MIFIIRGLLYLIMSGVLLVLGSPEMPLADLVTYFAFFLCAEAGILLALRHRMAYLEAAIDLLLVIVLFSGWVDEMDKMAPMAGGWFIVSGMAHIISPRRTRLSSFLVIAVGVVMLMFGIILFFRNGLEMIGFMGMAGIFLVFPGIIMLIGGLFGERPAD